MKEDDREKVDSKCRSLTASWVRERARDQNQGFIQFNGGSKNQMVQNVSDIENADKRIGVCNFYENFSENNEKGQLTIPPGVYTLEDLRDFGIKKKMCPYFLARHFLL